MVVQWDVELPQLGGLRGRLGTSSSGAGGCLGGLRAFPPGTARGKTDSELPSPVRGTQKKLPEGKGGEPEAGKLVNLRPIDAGPSSPNLILTLTAECEHKACCMLLLEEPPRGFTEPIHWWLHYCAAHSDGCSLLHACRATWKTGEEITTLLVLAARKP